MYSVRLLPSEYRIIKSAEKKRSIGLVAVSTASAFLFLVFVIISIVASGYEYELNSLKKQNRMYENQISGIKDIEALQNQVNAQLRLIQDAAGLSPDWDYLITSVGNITPENINLTDLAASFSGSAGMISIKGNALNKEDVTALIKRIEEIAGLGDVSCRNLNKIDGIFQFELSVQILSGIIYELNPEGSMR